MEPCLCGGCPRCGVEDRPEVSFSDADVVDLYRDAVHEILRVCKLKGWSPTEDLENIAQEYREGTFGSRMEREEEDRMMEPGYYDDGSDYDDRD